NGNWGVVDVQDCAAAAKYAVEKGLADPKRLAIAGGSAGGYTTLAALAFRDVFHVGADYFGLSDLELFIKDTHKFELRYLDRLIGKYPEKKELYIERSPVHHIEKIRSPVIIFQGAEDAIVPPSQSELMYKSLLERKIKTAYFLFEGEQHGFRQAANIQKCLEEEYRFYSQVFGIDLKKR
ncbi:MAG: S9 family peptidase, partial [Chlamydiae bacterium]|nr:S9 family peptidase [Chlamydiota bacterium]